MELIYLWCEKYHNIRNKGFSFSSKFDINYCDEKLTIRRCKNEEVNIYDQHVSNITLIAGKNGSGKTSILEMLTMPERKLYLNLDVNDRFFIIYWDIDNYFVIEEYFYCENGSFLMNNEKIANDHEIHRIKNIKRKDVLVKRSDINCLLLIYYENMDVFYCIKTIQDHKEKQLSLR